MSLHLLIGLAMVAAASFTFWMCKPRRGEVTPLIEGDHAQTALALLITVGLFVGGFLILKGVFA